MRAYRKEKRKYISEVCGEKDESTSSTGRIPLRKGGIKRMTRRKSIWLGRREIRTKLFLKGVGGSGV